ncbi:hypothetical protein CY34DRAFT_803395, partial [Suillus luteus UH-Slu-Lm8-n1]
MLVHQVIHGVSDKLPQKARKIKLSSSLNEDASSTRVVELPTKPGPNFVTSLDCLANHRQSAILHAGG